MRSDESGSESASATDWPRAERRLGALFRGKRFEPTAHRHTTTVQIKWEKGTLGTINVTMLTYPQNLEGSITVLGEKGTVKLGGNAVNQILHWKFKENSNDDKYVEKANYETTSIYGFGHPLYYKNMLDVLEGKASPYCDGKQGLKSLEIISAAYKSAFENSVINLPLER